VFAIGTETNGSIVCPSNNNGIVGLKPTVGLISRSGIIPISFTQDTPGPMGRTVEDVAIALGVMTGIDSSDNKTLDPKAVFHQDYTKFLKQDGLKGKRIGLMKNVSGYHARVDTLMKQTVAYLKSQGAEIIEIEESVSKGAGDPSFQVLLYEFKDGLNKYFASLSNPPVKDLQGLIEFNKKDSVELRYFDQKILEMAQAKGNLETKEYVDALAAMHKATREEGIDKVMNQFKLDALMAPTGSPAWKTDLIDGDHFLGGSSSAAAIAGYPSITVPMGFIDELPVNVSFFGRAWTESLLIEIAFAYEQGTKHRRSPRYILSN
jgi:amidase